MDPTKLIPLPFQVQASGHLMKRLGHLPIDEIPMNIDLRCHTRETSNNRQLIPGAAVGLPSRSRSRVAAMPTTTTRSSRSQHSQWPSAMNGRERRGVLEAAVDEPNNTGSLSPLFTSTYCTGRQQLLLNYLLSKSNWSKATLQRAAMILRQRLNPKTTTTTNTDRQTLHKMTITFNPFHFCPVAS